MTSRPVWMPLLALCAGATAVTAARAQDAPSPYYIGAATSYTRDDNIFRVGDNTPKESDSITAVTLLGGFDQPIGRQRIFAQGSVSRNEFADTSTLNNTSYSLSTGLDWETIERFAGDLRASANQNLARFNPDDGPSTTELNVQRLEQLSATVRMGLVTQLSAYAGVSRRTLRFTASEFDFREFDQDGVNTGLRYRFSGLLTVGVGLRHSESVYPLYTETDSDRVKRDNLDLSATWVPTGASTVEGRLSLSENKHSNAIEKDFSGVTGLVTWNWRPTGKLTLVSAISHDTGEDTTFLTIGNETIRAADSSRYTTAIRSRLNYAATAKIGVTAGLVYADRSLANSAGARGEDETTELSLGVRWSPFRTLTLACDATEEKRSSSGGMSTPYSFGTLGCSAQAMLNF